MEQDRLFEVPAGQAPRLSDWQGNIIPEKTQHDNPCIPVYGFGPEQTTCKTCMHLHRFKQAATWMKCDKFPRALKRKNSEYGPDFRANWQACGKYEQRITPYNGG